MTSLPIAAESVFAPPGDAPPPRHVAIIMDGNGRWAKRRGLPRIEGHRRGVEAVRRAVRAAGELGVEYLTVFSFSSENWSRPETEVSDLIGLMKRFIRSDLASLAAEGVRVRIIGDRETLPADLREIIAEAEDRTAGNTRLTLLVAFNYGGRQEIVRAAQRFARAAALDPALLDAVDAPAFAAFMDAGDVPEADLVIRTSGEQRISNFLLWQSAYAEFVFMPVLWPDFDRADFERAVAEFHRRDRRFGRVASGA
jgi:undecaprenyl diphosphate synthase